MAMNNHFRFKHISPVRFNDMDAGGHVHHSVALCYFEEAREAYWRCVVGDLGDNDIKYVIAELEVKYHRRILYPTVIEVGAKITQVGRKHLVMEYEGSSEAGDLLISGNTLLVMFDYRKGISVRVPLTVSSAISTWEELGINKGS